MEVSMNGNRNSYMQSGPEDSVEEWLPALTCSVLRVEGTRPVEEIALNMRFVIRRKNK